MRVRGHSGSRRTPLAPIAAASSKSISVEALLSGSKNAIEWILATGWISRETDLYIAPFEQHNTKLLIEMVRQQFKRYMHETDPEKIQKLKDDAARGLINHMLYEAEKTSGRKFSQSA